MGAGHDHEHAHDGAGFTSLDWLVLVAGVCVAVIAAEILLGTYIRERMSAQAQAFLARVRAGSEQR